MSRAPGVACNDFVAGGLAGSDDCELMEIWLDGRREPLATRANAKWGYVERYKTDTEGQIVLDPFGNAAKEIVRGKVEIRPCN